MYQCDFGVQRGVELAKSRPALVVSCDEFNAANQVVMVVPATQGGTSAGYPDFYPEISGLGTTASFRNLRTVNTSLLGRRLGEATRAEFSGWCGKGYGPISAIP